MKLYSKTVCLDQHFTCFESLFSLTVKTELSNFNEHGDKSNQPPLYEFSCINVKFDCFTAIFSNKLDEKQL